MQRFALTIYFDDAEQLRRFKAQAALAGATGSDLGKTTLIDVYRLDAPFFTSGGALMDHISFTEAPAPIIDRGGAPADLPCRSPRRVRRAPVASATEETP